MPSRKINDKVDRITLIPEDFLAKIPKAESEVYDEVVQLLAKLDVKNGKFAINKKNIQIVSQISSLLRKVLLSSSYVTAVAEFAKEFDTQAVLNDEIFRVIFPEYATSELAISVKNIAKRNAIDLFLNHAADLDFVSPLKSVIEQAVVNGSGYKETLLSIREFIEGSPEQLGALSRYSSTYAHDTFAISDRSYTAIVSKDIKAEWFLYSGGTIATTRPFCRERHGQWFHIKEIEGWFKTPAILQKGQHTPVKGNWAGMWKSENFSSFFSYAGGYNCGHSVLPQSLYIVPIDVIKRNIDAGHFTPTASQAKRLGL